MTYDFDNDHDHRPEAGELSLATAIIRLAVHDHRYGKTAQREDVTRFITSVWFEFLADGLGIDPAAVRERLGL